MAVTLSLTDDADGTGGVAAITSPAGAANVVYTSLFDAAGEVGPWVNSGNRTGTGNVTLNLAPGQYMVYVQSNDAGTYTLSTVQWFTFTSGVDSVHMRCIDAIVARLQSLALDGIDSASIVGQDLPFAWDFDNRNGKIPTYDLPGIIVSPFGIEAINPQEGTNYRDNIGYPCSVSIIAAQDIPTLSLNRTRSLWRSRAIKAFRNQRIPGVTEVWNANVEPQAIVAPDAWFQSLWNSSFVVRCLSREPRGV
jgi:hypothetical protein